MNIIGQTSTGYLLDASRNEIARLVGYYYGGEEKCPAIKPGVVINIDEMYQQLYALHNRKKELKSLANSLREYAALLEEKCPICPNIDCGPTKG